MHNTRKSIALISVAVCACATIPLSYAEPVNWRFQLGAMRSINCILPEKPARASKISALLGVETQFPLPKNTFLETGLDFRFGPETTTYTISESGGEASYKATRIPLKDFKPNDHGADYVGSKYHHAGIDISTMGFLEVPIRAGYKLVLNDENEFQFALGPVLSFALDSPTPWGGGKIDGINCFSVALQPSVVYKHRALTIGLFYQNPCIYNGLRNRDTNVLMATIGVNFYGRKPNWDNIIAGMEVASSVMTAVGSGMQTYAAVTGMSTGSGSSSYSGSSSGSSSSGDSYNSGSGRKQLSLSEMTARNADNNTYNNYVTMVIKILSGDDTVNRKSDIQMKMRQIRKKWEDRGYGWQASEYETK